MQAIYALPSVTRRWSGLTILVALTLITVLLGLSTLCPDGLRADRAVGTPTSLRVQRPNPGRGLSSLPSGLGSPSFGSPRPSFGGGNPVASAITKSDSFGWDDSILSGTELATGRKAGQDPEVEAGNSNSDSLVNGRIHPDESPAGGKDAGKSAGLTATRIKQYGRPGSYPGTRFDAQWQTTAPVSRTPADTGFGKQSTGLWWHSGAHPFFEALFPGIQFYRAASGEPASIDYAAVTRDSGLYGLDDINTLLDDQGFTFDSSEAFTIAKIAVFFAYCGRTGRLENTWLPQTGVPRVCDYGWVPSDTVAFPSVVFRKLTRGTWSTTNGVHLPGIWLDCVIGGSAQTVFVQFSSQTDGRQVPRMVIGPGWTRRFWPSGQLHDRNQRGAVPPTDTARGSLLICGATPRQGRA